ncbi:MAG: RDD family protein [Acidobacteriota bacterium]|nr:RDD family protein [Acidobacteriota bacterium]
MSDSATASEGLGARARSRRAVSGAEPARPLVRMVAGLCDAVLVGALDAAVVMLTLRLTGLSIESLGQLPLTPLVTFLLLLDGSYVVGLTAVGGQTVGKMACGVCVVDQTGTTVSTPAAVVRAGWAVVSVATVLGGLWMFYDRDRRALHDHLAGTRVTTAGRGETPRGH